MWYNINMVKRRIEPITWEAEEYIPHEKNNWWFVGLVSITLLLAGVSILLKQWTFLAVIILSALALLIYAVRAPRIIRYALSDKGLTEGDKQYGFDEFKSFGVLREEGHFAIVLTPRKRFSPRLTVYFPSAQGEMIVDVFGSRLPMEEVKLDFFDKLIKFLRI